jgi:AcrR family transcriptional regulator
LTDRQSVVYVINRNGVAGSRPVSNKTGHVMRTVKAPEVRRAELLALAEKLFKTQGYSKTSVDDIVRHAGVAKGTFYHYFKSKDDILKALTQQLVAEMAADCRQIAEDPRLNAAEKIIAVIYSQKETTGEQQCVIDGMHLPENRALHELINIETIQSFGPILADIVTQGNQQGLFQVDDPLSTVEFILAGSQFLFGEGIFNWSAEQQRIRKKAMITLIERAFAAKPGLLSPLQDGGV